MDIVIKNLPPNRQEADIHALVDPLSPINHITFFQPDHPDHGSCVVCIPGDRERAYHIAHQLNGHFWHGHELTAYVPLYGQRALCDDDVITP